MNQNFGVHRRCEDRSSILQLVPELGGVDQVAVVGKPNVPVAESSENGLRVLDRRRPGRAVPRVADRDPASEATDVRTLEPLRHEPHPFDRARASRGIDGDDAGRFLSAVLQRVQSEMRNLGGVFMTVDTKDSAHISGRPRERSLWPPNAAACVT
jgi:hypothetical protein